MNCYIHNDKEVKAICSSCGKFICNECNISVSGKSMCKVCVEKQLEEKAKRNNNPNITTNQNINMNGRNVHPNHQNANIDQQFDQIFQNFPPRQNPNQPVFSQQQRSQHGGGRYINAGVLFVLFPIPGLNYMYMGLIKKGLLFMAAFFASIYLASTFWFFNGTITFMIMATSFFMGLSTRRRLMSGEKIEDSIDDIIAFVKRYKVIFIALLAVTVGLSVLRTILFNSNFLVILIPFAFVAYLISRHNKGNRNGESNNNIEIDIDIDIDDENI